MPTVKFSKAGNYLKTSRRNAEDVICVVVDGDGETIPVVVSQPDADFHVARDPEGVSVVADAAPEPEEADAAPTDAKPKRGRKGRDGAGPVANAEV